MRVWAGPALVLGADEIHHEILWVYTAPTPSLLPGGLGLVIATATSASTAVMSIVT